MISVVERWSVQIQIVEKNSRQERNAATYKVKLFIRVCNQDMYKNITINLV